MQTCFSTDDVEPIFSTISAPYEVLRVTYRSSLVMTVSRPFTSLEQDEQGLSRGLFSSCVHESRTSEYSSRMARPC